MFNNRATHLSAIVQALATNRVRAFGALLVSTVLWDTSFIAAKSILEDIPPITLTFVRFAIALVILLPLLRLQGRRAVCGRDAALLGFSGVAVLFVCQNFGIQLAGAADAAMIMGGGFPVITAELAWMVLGERLHRRALAGLVASVIGVGLVFLVAAGSVGGSLLGDLLLLGSPASAAGYIVQGRRAFPEHGLLVILTGSAGWGMVMLSPFAVTEAITAEVRVPSLPDAQVLLYLGAGCSGLPYLLWGYSLWHLTATETAAIGNLEVIVGLAAAAATLHEPLTVAQIAGGTLVLAGVWLAASPATPDPVLIRSSAHRWIVLRLALRARGDTT
jgi:drug/metabolite transporter (DMT)-like permease